MDQVDGEPREVNFPPIVNGVDYLVSVVDLLSREEDDPSPRDLKYAVLHLQAASEVLLKERLRIEHWTLVVKDAGRTNRQDFHRGDIESITHRETVRRLAEVVGIEIGDAKKALGDLATTRNALQHWGLTALAPAVEARAAKVLDFLIRFIDDELLNELEESQATQISANLQYVRDGLNGIKAYVKRRANRLRGELAERADRVVMCPACMQPALTIGNEANKCHFCPRLWEAEELASEYASEVLGFSWHGLAEGGTDPLTECPDCATRTLVLGAVTAADRERPVDICFNCAEVFDRLESCTLCDRLYVPNEDELICRDCWRDVIASD